MSQQLHKYLNVSNLLYNRLGGRNRKCHIVRLGVKHNILGETRTSSFWTYIGLGPQIGCTHEGLKLPNLPPTPEGEGDVIISTHRWSENPPRRVGPSFLSPSSLRGLSWEIGSPPCRKGPTPTCKEGGGTRKPGPQDKDCRRSLYKVCSYLKKTLFYQFFPYPTTPLWTKLYSYPTFPKTHPSPVRRKADPSYCLIVCPCVKMTVARQWAHA